MATFQRSSFNEQSVYTELHKLLLTVKLSHYRTRSFAAHEALGKTYDTVNDLIDTITEKLIGYSDVDPADLVVGTVSVQLPKELGSSIISTARKIEELAEAKEYCDIENLAQELSGAGAQLRYLSRFA